jgi:hypothetical protein
MSADEETQETFSDEIPDDISLFPDTEGVPEPEAADEPEKPPAAAPAVEPEAAAAAPDDSDAEPEKPAEKPTEPPAKPSHPEHQRMMEELTKRDRALGERERALKEADRNARLAQEYEEHKRLMAEDPLRAIERAGGNAAKALEEKLGLGEKVPPEEQALAKIAELEARLEKRDAAEREAQQTARQEAATTQILNRYTDLVSAQQETYPHMAGFKDTAPGVMFHHAQSHALSSGNWIPDDVAARAAEEQLQREVEHVLDIASKMPQYQDRFTTTPTNGESREASNSVKTRQPPQGKTLSAKDTTTPPPAVKESDLVDASDEDVINAGLAAFHQTLKAKS